MFRSVATAVVLVGLGAAAASAQAPSLSSIDPLDVPSGAYGQPAAGNPVMWQTDPFAVGYNLLTGFRPVYSGVRQPIGHEMISTRADGNGYVYRPVYAPSPGFHIAPSGALIVERPVQHPTRPDAPFPSAEASPLPLLLPNDAPLPPRAESPTKAPRGPYEF